jgi:NADH:ubiquinone oxidoreductase subunit 5 (subunit L)/multisubunit Na+/H+ antiporter MnhA subunit
MFMAAGIIYAALGHDRIADLAGVARALPVTVLTFLLAGIALMGVIPSGAYLAKKLFLAAAADSGQWWWTIVLQGGAAFTAGYVVLVLVNVLRRPGAASPVIKRVSAVSQYAALVLALCSLLLALAAAGPLPAGLVSNPLAPGELLATLLVILGGVLLAQGLSLRPLFAAVRVHAASAMDRGQRTAGANGATGATGAMFARIDHVLRGWTVACVSLLLLSLLFGATLRFGAQG